MYLTAQDRVDRGVKNGAEEPVTIGIFGTTPVDLKLVDLSKPAWRKV